MRKKQPLRTPEGQTAEDLMHSAHEIMQVALDYIDRKLVRRIDRAREVASGPRPPGGYEWEEERPTLPTGSFPVPTPH